MTDQPAPRVKLPDVVARRPGTPGPNSWAQSKTHEAISSSVPKKDQPTNRDKYENKPMPKLPSEHTQDSISQKNTYIQPAVPLINTLPPSQKNRAVTDPVQTRAFLNGRKPSVSQLRRKFSSSKLNVLKLDEQVEVPYADVPEKAQSLLGLGLQRAVTPGNPISRTQSPDGQAQTLRKVKAIPPPLNIQLAKADPVKTARQSGESDTRPGGKETETSSDTLVMNQNLHSSNSSWNGGLERSSEGLKPPKVATYGNVGKVGIVQQGSLHSSGSFQGIIENASSSGMSAVHQENCHPVPPPQREAPHPPTGGAALQPNIYSPSTYGGVWENDPAVVSLIHQVNLLQ